MLPSQGYKFQVVFSENLQDSIELIDTLTHGVRLQNIRHRVALSDEDISYETSNIYNCRLYTNETVAWAYVQQGV